MLFRSHVDCPGKAEHADLESLGVRAVGVAPPVPAVAEDGDSADIDVDAFRHVDIGVSERREYRHRRRPLIDGGVAQIEVEISEGAGGEGPTAQPEPTASRDMTQQGRGEPGECARESLRGGLTSTVAMLPATPPVTAAMLGR